MANKVEYRNETLAANARHRANHIPDEVAVYLPDGNHISYRAIYEESVRLAQSLRELGVGPGDVVSFQLPNWREAVAIDIAVSMLGAIINPVIPIYRGRELAFILADCRSKVLFIPREFRRYDYPAMIQKLLPDLPELQMVVTVRGEVNVDRFHAYESLVADSELVDVPDAEVDPDDVKIIMYTSGTTGNPKAVLHSHNTLTRALDNGREAWQLGAGDVMLMPSPVTHITGFVNGIELPFFSEAKSAFMEYWDVDFAMKYIQQVQATACVSATPFLQELVQRSDQEQTTLPSLRMFACGGASVPPELIRSAHRTLANCRAFRVYGSTEAPLVSVGFQKPEEEDLAAETDGRFFNWDVRVRDDDGEFLPLGADGEIVVRGPALMLGYKDEEQTRQAMTPDGYFQTGDIGHLTPEDAIVITDRKKDIIIRGGENLSAREIEDTLYGHPDVAEVAVVAMPHERLGEGVCAWIVPRAGQEVSVEGLRPFLDENGVAKQKWPERVELVDELPKTASGKVRKDVLRTRIREKMASA